MKYLILLLAIFLFSFLDDNSMLNKRTLSFAGTTISNKKIDSLYFKDKVTLLNFMYIGCRPCMAELKFLISLDSQMKGKPFQILCIAPHSPQHLIDFNSDNNSIYSRMRKYFTSSIITYDILPECADQKPDIIADTNHISISPECDNISKLFQFQVKGYPMLFLIDGNGYIRKAHSGWPEGFDSTYIKQIKSEIQSLIESTH